MLISNGQRRALQKAGFSDVTSLVADKVGLTGLGTYAIIPTKLSSIASEQLGKVVVGDASIFVSLLYLFLQDKAGQPLILAASPRVGQTALIKKFGLVESSKQYQFDFDAADLLAAMSGLPACIQVGIS
jgi:hypothetical protein